VFPEYVLVDESEGIPISRLVKCLKTMLFYLIDVRELRFLIGDERDFHGWSSRSCSKFNCEPLFTRAKREQLPNPKINLWILSDLVFQPTDGSMGQKFVMAVSESSRLRALEGRGKTICGKWPDLTSGTPRIYRERIS
jgi:hypothetical protein